MRDGVEIAPVDRRSLATGALPRCAWEVLPPGSHIVERDQSGRLSEDQRARREGLGVGVGILICFGRDLCDGHVFTAATIPYPAPSLGGATFILQPFRADDFVTALTFAEDTAGVRWVEELPADDGAGVAEFLENSRLNGELLHVVIASRMTDAYLGEAMLVPGDDLVAEVGCCVLPTARRQGIATHALRLLTE